MTMQDAYQRTLDRAEYIRFRGLELVEKWECELREERKQNPVLDDFVKTCPVKDPLDPRQAFFGGRTNSHYLYY